MKKIDLFRLSIENFKSRKSRIVFTVLGFSVGIGAILFLVSLGFGLQKNLLEKITTAESLLALDIAPAETKIISLTPASLQEISNIPGVEKVSPRAIFSSQITLENITSEVTLNLIDPDYFNLNGVLPNSGEVFNDNDSQKAVINTSVAELSNLDPKTILGKKIKLAIFMPEEESLEVESFIADEEFEIVGVLDEADSPPQVYVKRTDLKKLPISEYHFAKVKVTSSEETEVVRERLISMGFLVSSLSDVIEQANKIFGVIQIVLGIFGVVALFVAAIGLINTMTISLLERTSEIGIMKAIGASPKDIQWIFLADSIIIGFLGGLGGIAMGIITSQIFNWLVNILANNLGGQPVALFYYPLWFILSISILSITVGFIAGFFPAQRAAKLNPLSALRYK
ncbi:MAG: ABC transporter permease [bacterium]